jgi:hypothetical protein
MCLQHKIMLSKRTTRPPLFHMLNTQQPLAHVVMETLHNHTQYTLISYSDKFLTVTLMMCIRELHRTNVPRETDGYPQSIWPNTVIFSRILSSLSLYHSTPKSDRFSVYWNQRDVHFIQFIENQRPLHVSSITCSSSGDCTQTAFGILRAYNVSWQ